MPKKDDREKRGRKSAGRKQTAKPARRGFTWPEEPAKGRDRNPPHQPWHSAGPLFGRPLPRRQASRPGTETLKAQRPEEAP